MTSSVDIALTDPLTAGTPGPDSSPWDEAQTLQMTRPLPLEPEKARSEVHGETLPTIGHIGRYALKYRIGEGGLGTVYAAHDPLLSRLIAVKTLNVDIPADARDTFNQLFLNEAKAAGSLSHPHIVTVFDAGLHGDGGSQGAYIAMELLKGKDLRQLTKDGWRPTPAQAALIVRRVADALAYAHTRGVVHCDIKPANIFMIGRTQPRVLDFGIARIARRRDAASRGDTTQQDDAADFMAGSPYYMAPEQVNNESVDRRADVYSLGVVLYELLTGHRPFDGETLSAITEAVLHRKPPSAHSIDPEVPKELSDIAERAMMRNREHRTHSARALSRELRHWLEQQSPSAFEDRRPAGSLKRSLLWAAGIGSVLALTAGMVWWGSMHSSGHDTPGLQAAKSPVAVAPKPAALQPAPPPPVLTPTPTPTTEREAAPSASAVIGTIAAASMALNSGSAAVASLASSGANGNAANSAPATATAPAQVSAAASTAKAVTSPTLSAGANSQAMVSAHAVELAPAASKAAQAPGRSTAKLTAKEKAELRKAAAASARASAAAKLAAPVNGSVQIAVTPWAQVDIDSAPAGTAPPLNQLSVAEGRHVITLRNDAFPPHTVTINVVGGETVTVRYRFGP